MYTEADRSALCCQLWRHHSIKAPGGLQVRLQEDPPDTSLVVQGLRTHASTAGGVVSIPGQGTRIPRAVQLGQKIKIKTYFAVWFFHGSPPLEGDASRGAIFCMFKRKGFQEGTKTGANALGKVVL